MTAPTQSRTVRFAWNAGWNLLGQIGLAALSFLLIPFIIRELGTEAYALYSLMGIIGGYLMLLTLGAGPATVKFVSEFLAKEKNESLGLILGTSLWLHGGLVALGSLTVLGFSGTLASDFFKISPSLHSVSSWIFACASIGAVFFSLNQCGLSILQGLQRYDLSNLITLFQSGIFLCGIALLLKAGMGMHHIGVLYVVVQAALCCLCLALAFRLLPVTPAWAPWRHTNSGKSSRFITYGLGVFVMQLAWSISFQWDRLFIAHFLPLSELTYYLIPSAILQKLLILPGALGSTAFPIFSELQGRGDLDSLKTAYRKCSQLVLWTVVPWSVLLMILAPQFLTLWLGEHFSQMGTWPLRLLLAGYFIHFMTAMAVSATQGIGHIRYNIVANLAMAGLCIVFWIILIPKFGIVGAAEGFLLAIFMADLPFLLVINQKLFGLPLGEYFKSVCLRPFTAGAILLFGLWLLRFRLFSWEMLLLICSSSILFYYSLGYWLLDEEGRRALVQLAEAVLMKKKAEK